MSISGELCSDWQHLFENVENVSLCKAFISYPQLYLVTACSSMFSS